MRAFRKRGFTVLSNENETGFQGFMANQRLFWSGNMEILNHFNAVTLEMEGVKGLYGNLSLGVLCPVAGPEN